jgi:ribosomal protein S18 acetylase RimI-like enzyme
MLPLPLSIREATPEDHEFILALVPELTAFGPPPWRDAAFLVELDQRFLREALLGRGVAGSIIFIAESAESVESVESVESAAGAGAEPGSRLGFIHLRPQLDYYLQKDCGHVADLVVAPAARGRGVGRALMTTGERWAREHGFEMLSLHVFAENRGARALYEELGMAADMVRYVKPLR